MSVNSSSTNDTLPSQNSLPNETFICTWIFSASSFTNILLLLPISILVLILGFQRWKHRSVSSAAVMSLSDFYTYNMAVIELIGILGNIISIICRYFAHLSGMALVGYYMAVFPWSAQMLFPILNCVERYLAAVRPITYLRLRQGDGVRIRNISAGLIWLMCFVGMGFVAIMQDDLKHILLINAILMVFYLTAVTFFSLSVLFALIRPRPGEVSRDRERADQLKQKAIHIITITIAVLFLRFGGNLVCCVTGFTTLSQTVFCVSMATAVWFSVPSTLVLPLLYLHKERKLSCCKYNTESR